MSNGKYLNAAINTVSTTKLVIMLQELSKDVSHYKPEARIEILKEAAIRLTAYRQAERKSNRD